MSNDQNNSGDVLDASSFPFIAAPPTDASLQPWAPTGDLIFDLMTSRITLTNPSGIDA